MLNNNVFYNISDSYIIKRFLKRRYLKSKLKAITYNLELLKDVKIDIKGKKAYIILEDEEINIRSLTLPKINGKALKDLIYNELFYYLNNMDNIVYDFIILREYKNNVDVLVYYIYDKKINSLDKLLGNKTKIYGVYLVQFCFLNYFKKKIKYNNYVFVFMYQNNLYLMYCLDNKVMNNSLFKNFNDIAQFENILMSFIEENKIYTNTYVDKIYFANCNCNNLLHNKITDSNHIDLGYISEKKFLLSIS